MIPPVMTTVPAVIRNPLHQHPADQTHNKEDHLQSTVTLIFHIIYHIILTATNELTKT